MNVRRTGGRETWHRLRDWDKGSTESERLAARLLSDNGYSEIDPSHPLGGRDGGQDIWCKDANGERGAVAVYFPRGEVRPQQIQDKFVEDLGKLTGKEVRTFAFFTNQEISLGERAKLEDLGGDIAVDIFHLERIATALDTPSKYGLRLEFLSIEMTREEQVSFFNSRDQVLFEMRDSLTKLANREAGRIEGKVGAKLATVMVNSKPESTIYSLMNSRLIECKNCHEVFRAQRNPAAMMLLGEPETVNCPECGKLLMFR
jgi:hypothetical protein